MLVRGLVVSGGGWHFFNCFLPESEKGGGDERRREGSRWWPTVERRREESLQYVSSSLRGLLLFVDFFAEKEINGTYLNARSKHPIVEDATE